MGTEFPEGRDWYHRKAVKSYGRDLITEVVKWIDTTRLCREFHVLPVTGGLFQQPGQYVSRMRSVLEAETEVQRLKDERDKLRSPEAREAREKRARGQSD